MSMTVRSRINQQRLLTTPSTGCTEIMRAYSQMSGAMVVHRGKEYKYLGMTIDYTTKGFTCILMIDYVKDILVSWDKASDKIEMDGFIAKHRKSSRQPTAAPSNLFTVDEASMKTGRNTESRLPHCCG